MKRLDETANSIIRHQYSFRKSLSNPGRIHNSLIHFVVDPSLMANEFKHLWLNTLTTNHGHSLPTNVQKLLHNNIFRGPMTHAPWPRLTPIFPVERRVSLSPTSRSPFHRKPPSRSPAVALVDM